MQGSLLTNSLCMRLFDVDSKTGTLHYLNNMFEEDWEPAKLFDATEAIFVVPT